MFYGLRFDVSAIVLSNSVFIILHLIPLPQRETNWYQKILQVLFYSVNSVAVFSNCVDLAYFQFTAKRTTADVFSFFSMGDDLFRLLPLFLKEYWYIFFIWIALTALLIYCYRKIKASPQVFPKEGEKVKRIYFYLQQSFLFVFFTGFFLIGYRGGFQLKPISIISAGEYTVARNIPLIINTPFSILKTLEQEEIAEQNYYTGNKLKGIYNPIHQAKKGTEFQKLNVVIIILESFSKEYIGSLNNNKGYTPFLDSLISQSLVFDRAFANGKKSIEGIPAIVAGIPTLMNEPYITSIYGSNHINSLANLLKEKGYHSSFYHGGTNGTMGFDAFAHLAGFDKYYGRTEYNNEKDYDGHWGIWDEEYFPYFAKQLNQEKSPFFSVVFSLTSHHPYPVPEKYKKIFKEEKLPIHKSIRYTDYSLRKFFETASQMPWFDNTLFVLTADHTGQSDNAFYSNKVGMYAIPIIFYRHNINLKGKEKSTIQQADIMPSVLDYLNYDKNYFSFGKSVFDTTSAHFSVSFLNGIYQLISGDFVLQFDAEKTVALYNYREDSLLENNLANDSNNYAVIKEELESHIKAIIQTYNYSLMKNQMIVR